jgi:hypothetical protein
MCHYGKCHYGKCHYGKRHGADPLSGQNRNWSLKVTIRLIFKKPHLFCAHLKGWPEQAGAAPPQANSNLYWHKLKADYVPFQEIGAPF